MIKYLSLFLVLNFLFITGAVAQGVDSDDWQTFRSEEYKFRFIYPEDWASKQGRGPNVEALISNNKKENANCNVVVRTDEALSLMDSRVFKDMSQKDIEEMTPEGSIFIKGGNTYIDNKDAVYMYVSTKYKTLDIQINFKQIMVYTIVNHNMYVISCGSSVDYFEKFEPILKRIISTFVFEFYNKEYKIEDALEENDATENFWLVLFLSFLLTWVIGLTPPLVTRYLLLKKPMAKKWAIVFCTIFVILNLILFIVMGSNSKTHAVLALIAYISYKILRKTNAGIEDKNSE